MSIAYLQYRVHGRAQSSGIRLLRLLEGHTHLGPGVFVPLLQPLLISQEGRPVQRLRAGIEQSVLPGQRLIPLQELLVLSQSSQRVKQRRVRAATSFHQFPEVPLQYRPLDPFQFHLGDP